ncbi:related to 37S ribosomal protein S28, mitochondrial [Saccharomycodes ludwigii]|uniref:Related to 37S ribosomal protein S28, mitochondrial n=1 Tax=Saccharomycodes ludwigii TaxID=36035 RepID=A0A376BCH9_9ASCO|nr:related to 37S ribosomal protein S28, mitochondrial [Saccharomycodes ludwigii]
MLSRSIINNATLQTRLFGTTSICQGIKAVKFLKAQKRKQLNQAKQLTLHNSLATVVDPVLGHEDNPFIARIMAEIKEPNVLANNFAKEEVDKFLGLVVSTGLKDQLGDQMNTVLDNNDFNTQIANRRDSILRILNIKNNSDKDAMKLAIRLAREEFQRFPGDTGSSEVQAACMTVRIHKLAKHIKEHKKDYSNTRILRMLVQQRQSILRYLKKDNPERYYWTIEKLGLNDSAVVHEFNMDKRYMQDFNFFGDNRILIKESKKVAEQKRKESRKQKKANKVNHQQQEAAQQ